MAVQVGDAAVGAPAASSGGATPEEAETVGTETFRLDGVAVAGLALPAGVRGTLTITTRQVRWASAAAAGGAGAGFAIPFPDVALHAISRDASAGAPPGIYCQVGEAGDELRLFPADAGADGVLERIFEAMCESAALCVDEEDEGEGGGGGGEMFTADGVRRLDELLVVPEGLEAGGGGCVANGRGPDEVLEECQFEDAEPDVGGRTG
jgi:hypothetical protein